MQTHPFIPVQERGNPKGEVSYLGFSNKGGVMENTINMLLDIKVPISVQLGQRRMTIRELLNLKKGCLVQLDRMAGEPVDIFIASKILAKGEVTVVNDMLSVRIGQLYDEKEKFKHL